MVDIKPLYTAVANSPFTSITKSIDATATVIPIGDGSVLPDAPNIATIGAGFDAETIYYESKDGNTLSNVTRGLGGTVARDWVSGTVVARRFTAYDHNSFVENIREIGEKVTRATVVGSASDLAKENPVLEAGQCGYEVDTGKLKIGNGTTEFNDLPYFASEAVRTIFLSGAGGIGSASSEAPLDTITAPTYGQTFDAIKFVADATENQYREWTFVMPENYDGGPLTATFYWTVTASEPTGDVVFGIQGRSYGEGENLDQEWGEPGEVTDTVIGPYLPHISPLSTEFTLSGTPTGGELVQIRVYRNVESKDDDCSSDIFLQGVIMTYHTISYSDRVA